MAAYLPKSSTENERTTIAIEATNGQEIVMRQIAGAMAKRIVSYAPVGGKARQNEHAGFIKFGSRVDLYLPLGTKIDVKTRPKSNRVSNPYRNISRTRIQVIIPRIRKSLLLCLFKRK